MFDGLKKIIEIENDVSELIPFTSIHRDHPIFVVRKSKLAGMVVKEDGRWIVRTGGGSGVSGSWESLRECLKNASQYNYSFYVADEKP